MILIDHKLFRRQKGHRVFLTICFCFGYVVVEMQTVRTASHAHVGCPAFPRRLSIDHFVDLEAPISWQVQYFVDLEAPISWQVQYFVDLEAPISWQAQYFVDLEAPISWQVQY